MKRSNLIPRQPWERLLAALLLLTALLLSHWLAPRGFWPRLFGPWPQALAALQWMRADQAFAAGDLAVALSRAERALRLAPHNPDGWASLVIWQGGSLASATRQCDRERRRAWLEAALATAERARGLAEPYAPVAAAAAAVLLAQAESDPPLSWPGGVPALQALAERYRLEVVGPGPSER
jgi:hypothetical protein